MIVCLCGSTKFHELFTEVNCIETLRGNIVLAPGVFGNSIHSGRQFDKQKLDDLHRQKIEMSDKIIVINPRGYIGDSTRAEIEYAKSLNKPIEYTHEYA